MKFKNRFTLWVVMLVTLYSDCLNLLGQDHGNIKLTGDPWPPWNLGQTGKPEGGIAVEIAREVFRRAGVEIDMNLYPWKRCLYQMQHGQKDVTWFLTKNTKREQYMLFTEPLLIDPYLLYYATDRETPFEWNTWVDLKPYWIGLTAGFNYGDDFWAAAKEFNFRFQEAPTDLQNIKKLILGRIDFTILNRTITHTILREQPEYQGKITPATKPISESAYYMAFSKKSPAVTLLPKINGVIKKMKDEGTIDKLLQGQK